MINFATLKCNLLIIATDDASTQRKLQGNWPDNAFLHGVKPLIKASPDTAKSIIFRGIDLSDDFNDGFLAEQLKSAGLNFEKRLVNSNSNTPTRTIKLKSTDLASYKQAIRLGVRIGYQTFKAEPETRVLQCYKCQKPGHSAWNCNDVQVCLKCAGPHSHKDCTASVLKCSNCNQNLAACSRQCESLKKTSSTTASKQQPQPLYPSSKKSYSQIVSKPNTSHNRQTQSNPTLLQLEA